MDQFSRQNRTLIDEYSHPRSWFQTKMDKILNRIKLIDEHLHEKSWFQTKMDKILNTE